MSAERVYAQPQRGHVSIGRALRALLFFSGSVVVLGLVLF